MYFLFLIKVYYITTMFHRRLKAIRGMPRLFCFPLITGLNKFLPAAQAAVPEECMLPEPGRMLTANDEDL